MVKMNSKDFSYCYICHRSFFKLRSHMFTSLHARNVWTVLDKYSLKIRLAKGSVDRPAVVQVTSTDQKDRRFWCYFCLKEFPRHLVLDGSCLVENAGLLEHIASAQHLLATRSFWRNNRLHKPASGVVSSGNEKTTSGAKDTNFRGQAGKVGQTIMQEYLTDVRKHCRSTADDGSRSGWKKLLKTETKTIIPNQTLAINTASECKKSEVNSGRQKGRSEWRMEEFLLSQPDWQRLMNGIKVSIARHFANRDEEMDEEKGRIVLATRKRMQLVHDVNNSNRQMPEACAAGIRVGHLNVKKKCDPQSAIVRTIAAFGEGLTYIGMPKFDEAVGNVYSNAPPPWLQSNDRDASSTVTMSSTLSSSVADAAAPAAAVIGPTADDYTNHLKRERKAKLPATRVGAKYDRKTAMTASDLPSFGSVWSKNRRLQQQARFKRIWRQQEAQGSTSSSLEPQVETTSFVDVLGSHSGELSSAMHPVNDDGVSSGLGFRCVDRNVGVDFNSYDGSFSNFRPTDSPYVDYQPFGNYAAPSAAGSAAQLHVVGAYQRKRPVTAVAASAADRPTENSRLKISSSLL